ncbi:hypothetical protein C9374_013879 [Naegleria lovaniensis]|uniref:NADH:flavin oxidoreductase/NADH oxidase N-terminal domain-containing protein n=1 Tax=Naegleria lovaniensis TaxID=51637 RepID=A0AA88KPN6_NAELO|nr:uncharacterized protein C9374_013879 [Naegleria lovaniensis]KAG2389319.1 hypothetical protein C9374_013879 [Naegleria lovaniensis]
MSATASAEHKKLFTPLTLGVRDSPNFKLARITLSHRVVMAPLTRCRALNGDCEHTDFGVEYYSQRASKGGLIIAEATQITPQGQGYPNTPGIYSQQQIEAWKKITESVHQKGGFIFLQLWHVGRQRYAQSVSSSEVGIKNAKSFNWETNEYVVPETPKSLTIEEIKEIIKQYKQAAMNAKLAGFDGVELHAANGYLVDQFLQDGVNKRNDEYGGSIENRLRFMREAIEAVIEGFDHESHRVGIRLSPSGVFLEISDSNPNALFSAAVKALDSYDLAYIHLVEPRVVGGALNDNGEAEAQPVVATRDLKPLTKIPIISAGGFNAQTALQVVEEGVTDMIAFGRYFISNPDLPERIKRGVEFSKYDRSTFYGSKDVKTGYTDYPFYQF